MSENSSARTWVIDWDRADTISGNRSVMPAGMDAGAVHGGPALGAGGLDAGLVPSAGKEPIQRGDHVLPRRQQSGDHGRDRP